MDGRSPFLEQYHFGVVVEYDNTSEKDPKAKAVGIVTLEDIIEEMIQEEIVDETDVFSKSIQMPCALSRETHFHK